MGLEYTPSSNKKKPIVNHKVSLLEIVVIYQLKQVLQLIDEKLSDRLFIISVGEEKI